MNLELPILQSRYFKNSDSQLLAFEFDNFFWDFTSKGWWSRIYEYSWMVDVANSTPNRNELRAIDFATGNKHPGSLILKKMGFNSVTCTDIFDKSKWQFNNVANIEYKQSDITKDFVGKYDFVCCISVIEHLQNQKEAIENLCKHVNYGGCLLLTFDIPGFDYPTDLNMYKEILKDNNMKFFVSEDNTDKISTFTSEWAKPVLKESELFCYRIFAANI